MNYFSLRTYPCLTKFRHSHDAMVAEVKSLIEWVPWPETNLYHHNASPNLEDISLSRVLVSLSRKIVLDVRDLFSVAEDSWFEDRINFTTRSLHVFKTASGVEFTF